MRQRLPLFLAAVLLTVFVVPMVGAVSAWPADAGVEIGTSARALYPTIEPSGLAWHSGRNQLLMVGDEGQLMALNTDGSNVTLWQVGGDLEDVTVVDPTSSYVYLDDENGRFLKYNLSTSTIAQSWDFSALFPEVNGLGIEGFTYVDGYFYAGYQYTGKIYKLDLSGTSVVKVSEMAGLSSQGYTDLSGLSYKDNYLYALYSGTMAVLSMDGTVQATYSVPGGDQEGVTLGVDSNGDGDANMFIAEDNGGNVGHLYSYDNFPIYGWTAPVVTPPVVTDPDGDGDGVAASLDCNDADASVSSFQTYYVDADLDSLGSKTAASLCEATAPSGYANNSSDSNDTISNYGVEISNDKVDNDGDGIVDEHNTVATNGYHPYYKTLDAAVSSKGKILGYWGLQNGDIGVRYGDYSVYRYSVSDARIKSISKVSLVSGTAYLNITVGGVTTKINGYTGQIVP